MATLLNKLTPLNTTSELRPHTQIPKDPLVIKNLLNNNASVPLNGRTPTPVSGEYFDGAAIFKIKTSPPDPYYAPYFNNKKRLFEFVVQGKFKNIEADDEIYIGLEIPGYVPMDKFERMLVSVITRFAHKFCPGSDLSVGTEDGQEDAHIIFPMGAMVDRLIITPGGQEEPELGVEELPEIMKKEERIKVHNVDCESIYTFSVHEMYLDLYNWKVCHIPGVPEISLRRFWGDRGVHLVAYALPKGHLGPHTRDAKKYLVRYSLDQRSFK